MSEKKKFKDTKIGQFLKNKAPNILDIVGDVLPDQGALSIVKNLINKDDTIDAETKKELHNQLIEAYKTEVADRDSARKREVEIAKVRKFDFMFTLTGLVGLSTFVFLVYAIVYINIPEHNEKTFYTLIGLVEGITLSIFSFYFGASIRKN